MQQKLKLLLHLLNKTIIYGFYTINMFSLIKEVEAVECAPPSLCDQFFDELFFGKDPLGARVRLKRYK